MAVLKDVAKLAGVSVTTASIVANGKWKEMRISPDTVQRVLAAMEEVHYHPNQSARQLRLPNQHHIRIAFFWPIDVRTNMLGQRLAHIYSVLMEQELDYEIVVQTYLNNRIEDFASTLTKGRVDGAIIGAATDKDIEQLERLNISVPIVLLNRVSHKFSTVGVDHAQLGMQIAALIQKKGYAQCAVIKTAGQYHGATIRTRSFLNACKHLGIAVRPEWTFSGQSNISGGAFATEEYCALTERPKMLYYEADCMAQGGLYVLQSHGISVPQDVELIAVGTQSPETMEYLHPSISCVSLPTVVDKQAMSTLIRMIQEHIQEPIHIELEPQVQLRGSFSL